MKFFIIIRHNDEPEGAEFDCPECGETAIMTDEGAYCPNCEGGG